MAKAKTVDEYMAGFPAEKRAVLEKLRSTIRATIPKATEVISYSIPAYKLDGETVIFFAGWKNHCSLYPVSAEMLDEDARARYETSKGTIRFPDDQPIPTTLVKKLVRARVAALGETNPKAGQASSRRG